MASMLKSKLGGVNLRSRSVVAAPRVSIKAAGLPSLRLSAKTVSAKPVVAIPQRMAAPLKAASSDAAVPVPEPKKFLGFEALTWAKIIPLAAMFFCILFNYTILRDTKDVLVVTAPGSGAEIIPFLKTWVNLPMAILFTIGYSSLSNTLSTEQLFYTCIIPFIIFFGCFAAFMYPARDFLHPTEYCKELLETMGPRFAGPIAIVRNWTFCLFYVMAELWGSVVVSVLFWGFANQITTVEEASQFYPLFGLGANVALIFSGQAVKYFSLLSQQVVSALSRWQFFWIVPPTQRGEQLRHLHLTDLLVWSVPTSPPEVDGWGVSLNGLMGMVCIGGILISLIYFGLNRLVVPQIKELRVKKKKIKTKMSVGESFGFLAASPYIRDMATLVVAYGISINLVEVTWKSKLKAQFPNPNEYSIFMGEFSTATGIVTFGLMIMSRWIFKKFGWGESPPASPPPCCWSPAIGITPLYAAVLVGAAQNVFSKGSKYSLFDPCKEMAYIPLEDEMKVKGKAAIDVICNPLGKSGGALIQQFMIIGFGSLAASTPYLAAILGVIIAAWLKAAASLNLQFIAIQAETGINAMEGEKE
ncbi:MAG: hypothetical protein WDW38_010224 [Sanguina aurantia]